MNHKGCLFDLFSKVQPNFVKRHSVMLVESFANSTKFQVAICTGNNVMNTRSIVSGCFVQEK